MRRALREAGVVPDGGNCRQQPLRERSIEDILRDPSLCFEDQVAMFMARFMEDRQEEVKEQMRRMARQGAASSLEGREREAAVDARYPVLQQALAEGAEGLSGLGPAAAGLLDFVAPMVPALASMASAPVGTAVGAAIGSIVPGAGTAVGAAIGGMVSAALPVVLPMLVEAARDALRGGESSPTGGSARAHPSLSPALARNQTRGAHEALSTTSSPRARQETMTAEGGSWSMQTEMERLKMLINGMQQMQQAMSNILNTMHQGTMNVVRNIR